MCLWKNAHDTDICEYMYVCANQDNNINDINSNNNKILQSKIKDCNKEYRIHRS